MTHQQLIKQSRDAWKFRRIVIFITIGYCMVMIALLSVFGRDSVLHQTISEALSYLMGMVILGYAGLPVIDDHLRRKSVDVPTV
jgi:hypothetical protein